MMRRLATLAWVLLAAGCSDVTELKNGQQFGPVVTLVDWFTSCQLLETSAGPVLFDACWREGELTGRLKARGLAPGDVTTVFLTHAHQDHVGGLASLTNARVLGFSAEQPVLEKYAPGRRVDQPLNDGEVVTVGGVEVQAFAMPGHTPGSAAYLVGGALVLGDNGLFTARGAFASVPEDRSEDPALLIRSVVALADRLTAEGREVKWIVPAHSGGREGRAALDAFVAAKR